MSGYNGDCERCDYTTGRQASLDDIRMTVALDGGRVGVTADDLHCPRCKSRIYVEGR